MPASEAANTISMVSVLTEDCRACLLSLRSPLDHSRRLAGVGVEESPREAASP